VVLTARTDTALIRRAARAGACCLLPKNGELIEVLHALRTARRGQLSVAPAMLMQLMADGDDDDDEPVQEPAEPPLSLTPREHEVIRALADGHDVRRMAASLGISPHTCRGHVARLLAKLGAHSQLEAVAMVRRRGLLDRDVLG
jgi:DNA-binding NarL/FixJ family response regulator